MKYKVTLNGRTYEVEVEAGKAMLLSEYEAVAPAPVAASDDGAIIAAITAAILAMRTDSGENGTFRVVSFKRVNRK